MQHVQRDPVAALTSQPAAVAATQGRIGFVDACKALGIVAVVVGHAPGTPEAARTLIYSVHMPLFFFLSGYLLRPERIAAPPRATVQQLARALLVPYVFFFALSLAWWLATRGIGARAQKFAGLTAWDALAGLVSGVWSDLFVNVVLWFLPCMFVCQLTFAMARRQARPGTLLLALALLALLLLGFTLPWLARLPWGLDIAWVALVFLAAGHWLRSAGRGAPAATTAALLALAWLSMVALQGRVDLANATFGKHPLLYLPCALAGVGCVLWLGQQLPPSRAATLLARHSLTLFALHPLLIELLSGVVKLSGLQAAVDAQPILWSLVASAWGLGAGLLLSRQLMRHVPVLLGQRSATAREGVA